MGPSAASPRNLLRQTSRTHRSLTPRQLTPLAVEASKDFNDDDNYSPDDATKPRPISYDRSRSPSPIPPTPPPRPVSKIRTSSPPPPEITDPDALFQQAGFSSF